MLKITFLTLFPEAFDSFLTNSIIKRAISKEVVEFKVINIRDFTLDKVLASLDTATPGSKWNGSLMKNNNGVDIPNSFFIYQDTYVFGKGYMGITSVEIPEKYTKIGN